MVSIRLAIWPIFDTLPTEVYFGEYFRPGLVSQVFRRACPSGSSQVNDTIEVPGVGEETVTLDGTYRIQRSQPTTPDWETSTIDVKMLDLECWARANCSGVSRSG